MGFKVEKEFISNVNCLPSMNQFLHDNLEKTNIDPKLKARYIIVVESIVQKLIDADAKNNKFTITIKVTLGKTYVYLDAEGPEISENIEKLLIEEFFPDEIIDRSEFKDLALSTLGLDISNKYKNGCNSYRIVNIKSQRTTLIKTLVFMAAGAIFGLLVRFFIPESIGTVISKDVLMTIYNLFLNAIKMMLTPLIFLSIVSSIASFTDIGEIKKVVLRVMNVFIVFTTITLLIGFSVTYFFPIADTDLQTFYSSITGEIVIESNASNIPDMIADTIKYLMPTNIITPFLESIITQTIVLGLLVGIALVQLGDRAKSLIRGINKLEMLVSKIVKIIIYFLPIAVFCSLASTCISLEAGSFMTILTWMFQILCCMAALFVVYLVGVALFSDTKVSDFLKSFMPVSLISFTVASSAAAMPESIKACIEKLHVPRKIASLSVPLGTTINLNGTMMTVTITSLFLISLSGVELPPSILIIFFFDMFILALGTPAVPGGGIVLISTILSGIGIPLDITNLIVGVYPLLDMVQSGINTTSTGAATLIATKSITKKYPEYKTKE